MVAGKLTHHSVGGVAASSNNSGYDGYEIRSGMSVQDLKQLTAQRQCMEYWELQARNSPRQVSGTDWGVSSPSLLASPGSTSSMLSSPSSDSPSDSPPRARYPKAALQYSYASYQPHASPYRYGGYSRLSPRGRASSADKMFVTYGGQVVSFMEGVVNAPQIDCLADMLAPL